MMDSRPALTPARSAMDSSAVGPRPSVIQLVLRDHASLHAAYMPALQNGGLFVATTREHALGDEAYLLVVLPDETTRHPVVGRVIWITPPHASGGRPQGIGVAFSADEKAQALRQRIEAALGTAMAGARPTHTL